MPGRKTEKKYKVSAVLAGSPKMELFVKHYIEMDVEILDQVKKIKVKFEEIREMGMGNLPVRGKDGELEYRIDLASANNANIQLAKIFGAYEKDNIQKAASLPVPQINILNQAPRRASSEEEIES
jgi:hypothetical protein